MNQPNMSVEASLDAIRAALERASETAWKSVDDARRSKNPDSAQQGLDRVRALDQLLHRLAAFRSEFEDCVGLLSEPAVTTRSSPPGGYTVEKLRRRSRSRDLEITSRKEYYFPILEALVELGGRAKVAIILDRVGEKMQDRFSEADRAILPEGNGYRWRNHAQWARLDMVKEGLLRQGSPNGIWEITGKGSAWLERHYS